ncbi:macrocin-O-methyltransferase [Aureococcus anophagefferens]|nr:macrocin-O-methyltransferase [Aureococcus anophagefferens]
MDPVALVIEVGSMSGMMNRFAAAALCLAAAAGDEGTTRATCEALAAQRGLAAGAAACGFGEGPRWVAYNNLGLAHYVGGRPALARQHFARAARLAPLEPVALANLLWLEVVENRAEAEEATAVVASSRGAPRPRPSPRRWRRWPARPRTRGSARRRRSAGREVVRAARQRVRRLRADAEDRRGPRPPRWAADEREPGDDAPWAPPASAGGAALAVADLEPPSRTSARGVAGGVAECGVFSGGTAALAAAALEAFDASDSRRVFAVDSFAGIPEATGDAHTGSWPARSYAAPEADVALHFYQVGAGERLRIVKGPFAASLPAAAEPARVAVLRVDADTFEGTRGALDHLYDRVAPGGLVIVDDYHLGGCRRAVREFREARGVAAPLLPAPIDYVLTCPRLPANKRALLAEDVLLHGRRILQPQMFVAQNVYWRKP